MSITSTFHYACVLDIEMRSVNYEHANDWGIPLHALIPFLCLLQIHRPDGLKQLQRDMYLVPWLIWRILWRSNAIDVWSAITVDQQGDLDHSFTSIKALLFSVAHKQTSTVYCSVAGAGLSRGLRSSRKYRWDKGLRPFYHWWFKIYQSFSWSSNTWCSVPPLLQTERRWSWLHHIQWCKSMRWRWRSDAR